MTPAGDAHQNCCSKKCLHVFSQDEIENNSFNVEEMTKEEKQHLLLSILSTSREDGQTSRRGKRIRASVKYSFKDVKVCRNAFMHTFNVNKHTIKSLSAHISENGVCTKKHGNAQRRPHNAAKYEDVLCIVNFVSNYANLYGMPQPAAPRGRDGLPQTFLPASATKVSLHSLYETAQKETGKARSLKRTAFIEVHLYLIIKFLLFQFVNLCIDQQNLNSYCTLLVCFNFILFPSFTSVVRYNGNALIILSDNTH